MDKYRFLQLAITGDKEAFNQCLRIAEHEENEEIIQKLIDFIPQECSINWQLERILARSLLLRIKTKDGKRESLQGHLEIP